MLYGIQRAGVWKAILMKSMQSVSHGRARLSDTHTHTHTHTMSCVCLFVRAHRDGPLIHRVHELPKHQILEQIPTLQREGRACRDRNKHTHSHFACPAFGARFLAHRGKASSC